MTIAYATAAPVMLQLGSFQFGINTAAYQSLARSEEWRWPEQSRFGQETALQYTGPGAASVTLDGVIYPEWKGGFGQLDAMRREAGKGQPLVLVDGRGQALGMWVIESVSETQGTFAAGGVARRIEFSLQLKRFSSQVTGPVPKLPPLPKPAPPVSTLAATPALKTKSLADHVIEAAQPLISSASNAYKTLQAQLAPATAVIKDAAGAAKRCADAARQIQTEAQKVKVLVGDSPAAAQLWSRLFGERAAKIQTQAESAARILRRAVDHLEATPEEAARAVIQATDSANRTIRLCRVVVSEALKIARGREEQEERS
ncbi:MAG: phage tail protein [Lautropia sp.]|nr:phage tail protein [Lautropia sp.]